MALSFLSRFRTLFLYGGPIALVGFIGLQFIRPDLPNPPVVADLQAPAPVKQILTTSCYNCHSNETKLPWFDQIVPAYWLVVQDVKDGRRHMNFSNFGQLPPAAQQAFLYESVNQIQLGAMPPRKYTLIHPEAIITPDQLKTLKDYLHPNETTNAADPAHVAEADAQYQAWIANTAATAAVQPEFNGLAFFPDYKDWKPISTTDRFDNDTFRVILGNDIAVRAIAENNIHPWPDGAAFAKIAWYRMADDKGFVRTGKFKQVEFMIKDATKYASTEGWGFGRWLGTDHTPYGKDASYTMECTSCHAPMHANDFVYTMPIHEAPATSDVFNFAAALPGDLPYQPLQWRVITSSVDKPSGTMSVLYGNDLAITYARTNPHGSYPLGAVISLVTWHQQEDRHWFGGRIPGQVASVEFVTSAPSAGLAPGYTYQSYTGTPLTKQDAKETPATWSRVSQITGMRAAVMP